MSTPDFVIATDPDPADVYPLTDLQRSMALSSLRAPRSGVYVIQDVCESGEDLDAALLRRAWRSVAAAHPALRTQIESGRDGNLRQSVGRADPEWCELDWTAVGADRWVDALSEWLREDRQRGFSYGPEVPLRLTLLRRRDGLRTVILTAHHVVVDGGSLRNVWKDWFAAYDGFRADHEIRLDGSLPFRAYVDWLEGQDLTGARQYWCARLADLAEGSGVLADRLHRASNTEEPFAKFDIAIPESLSRELAQFASTHEITLHTLVQGAWALLLSRYNSHSQTEVTFGVVRNGRRSPGLDLAASVGMFINTLPLRVAVPRDAVLATWLQEVHRSWASLQEFEHTPASRIREWCGLPAGVPLFNTLLIYEHERVNENLRRLGGSWVHRSITRRQRTDSALTVCAYGRPALALELVYDTRVFSERTIAAMGGHLRTLLAGFATEPRRTLGSLDMLDAGETRQMQAWNQTLAPIPANACAHHRIEAHARRISEHAALENDAGPVTYGELNRRANQLARLIRKEGARPDDRVAVVMHRSPEAVIAVLAVLKAGAAFLPLSPSLPPDRLAWMLANARVRLTICREADRASLSTGSGGIVSFDRVASQNPGEPAENLPDAATPSHAAYVIYTSGSTGKPKAIEVTHRSLVNYTMGACRALGISDSDRRLQFASLSGDLFVSETFNYLSSGATLVSCLNPAGVSVHEFVKLLDERRITITGIPSSWWNEWVAGMADGHFALPKTVRTVVLGMERVQPATVSTWRRLIGDRIRLFNAYGPAEATCIATLYEMGSSEWEAGDVVPIGKPLPNVTAYVLDGGGTRLPVGVGGELHVGGEGIARGYVNAPDQTKERFVADPFSAQAGGRLYRTGDLAFFLPDGNLAFAGRADRQVKIRGFRVELDEIEAVLAEHPAVLQCAVILQEQPNRQILVAYVAPNGAPAPDEELRLHLARRLPGYMVPAAFLTLPQLPLTSNGKVDRLKLPPYVPGESDRARPLLPPSTPTERRLCELWRDVLGIDQVSITDSFFDLGGDSLRVTRLITQIHSDLGKDVTLALLLRAPTVALLATALDAGDTTGPFPPALISLQPFGSRPPFYCVHGSGRLRHLARHLGTDQPFLGLPRLDWPDSRPHTLEETAANYVAVLRTFQPQGPYFLGGCCYAGVLAYEMARQLNESGESVPLLVLFDAVNPAIWGFRSWKTILAMARYHAGVLRSMPVAESLDYAVGRLATVGNVMRDGVRRALRSSAVLPTAITLDITYAEAIGYDRYRPKPYGGSTLLFRGGWTRPYVDARFGWGDLVGSSLEVVHLAGEHLEMLEEPMVATLARQLEERLRAAEP